MFCLFVYCIHQSSLMHKKYKYTFKKSNRILKKNLKYYTKMSTNVCLIFHLLLSKPLILGMPYRSNINTYKNERVKCQSII